MLQIEQNSELLKWMKAQQVFARVDFLQMDMIKPPVSQNYMIRPGQNVQVTLILLSFSSYSYYQVGLLKEVQKDIIDLSSNDTFC